MLLPRKDGLKARPQGHRQAHWVGTALPVSGLGRQYCVWGLGSACKLGSVTWNLQIFFYSLPNPKTEMAGVPVTLRHRG